MIVRQTIYKETSIPNWEEHDIARSIHSVAFGFLIPLFFVWVGISTDLTLIPTEYVFIIVLFLIAVIGTVGGTVIATMLNKGSFKEGLATGLGLNPKGDVELVIAALVVMSLLTTIISPVVFKYLIKHHKKQQA